MKQFFLLISILLSSICAISQNGFTLNFETENLQGKTIELSNYYGSSRFFYSKEVAGILKNNQTVQIKDTNVIHGGVYKLNFIGQKESIDILIDNGDNLTFKLDTFDINQLSVSNSKKNKIFHLYNKTKNDTLIDYFLAKFPESEGALFFLLEKTKQEAPNNEVDRAFYQATFWDSIDLNNQQLQFLPNLYSTLNFYTKLQPINDSTYTVSMNRVLNQIDSQHPNFEFILNWYFKNMNYNYQYYLDKTFVNTYKKYFDTLQFKFKNISNFRALENRYDDISANMKGSVISDFTFLTLTDSAVTLSEVYPENDFTFIAFYDPDCFHCQKAMPKLTSLFSEIKKDTTLNIATIGMLNAYDNYGWVSFTERNNMQDWINLYSKDPNKEYQQDFNTYSNPRFFLVDKNGILLSRSGIPAEIARIINLKK